MHLDRFWLEQLLAMRTQFFGTFMVESRIVSNFTTIFAQALVLKFFQPCLNIDWLNRSIFIERCFSSIFFGFLKCAFATHVTHGIFEAIEKHTEL